MSLSLQKELDETNLKLSKAEEAAKLPTTKKKAPMLGSIGKFPSSDGVSLDITFRVNPAQSRVLQKVSRESLTRGGSQDDPAQLLRDLQDSLEREADLREQLKFAEEEVRTNPCLQRHYQITEFSKILVEKKVSVETSFPWISRTPDLQKTVSFSANQN